MRTPLAAAAALFMLAARPAAGADPPGPIIALRLGIAAAFGYAATDVPASEAAKYQYPIQLEVLWSFGRAAAGAYVSWGLAQSSACEGACASVTRAGLDATWTFGSWGKAETWAGIGAGYEWATERVASSGGDVMSFWRGFELFSVQGGLEWRAAPAVALGPYVMLGAGRYTNFAMETDFEAASAELSRRSVHAWANVGVRVRLIPGAVR